MTFSSREFLRDLGIKPTATRLRIFNYLHGNLSHPTADQIYCDLSQPNNPISRATVYNTLRIFSEKGLVSEIRGTDDIIHYDLAKTPHGHFQCKSCNRLWNLPLTIDAMEIEGFEHFDFDAVDVLVRGTCPDCQAKED